MSRRRYVARGVPGGYRIWDNKGQRFWGDLYDFCPDDLLDELNGQANPDKITELLKRLQIPEAMKPRWAVGRPSKDLRHATLA